MPPITAPGSKSITSIISSGTGSGTSARMLTPRPLLAGRDFGRRPVAAPCARGDASSSSIGTPSAPATFTSTISDGLPAPDSRFAIVERGTAAAFASAPASASARGAGSPGCAPDGRRHGSGAIGGRALGWRIVRTAALQAMTLRQCAGQARSASGRPPYRQVIDFEPEAHHEHPTIIARPARRRHRRHLGARPRAGARAARARRSGRLRRARRASASRASRASTPARTASSATSRARTTSIRIALQITGALGGLDVLVNNASDLGPVPLALLADTECEDLERALATNLLGPFRLTKALLGALGASAREGRGARGAQHHRATPRSTPMPRWGAYGASKAALLHLSRIWDEELRGRRRARARRSIPATWTRRCTRSPCPTPTPRR